MSSPERLLAEYIEAHRSGEHADPLLFVNRADSEQRLALAALIDAYLARAPRRPFDQTSGQDAAAEATIDALQRTVVGASGTWPVLLPRLRARAGLKRDELVRRLSQTLGVGAQTEKVGRYYHEMEQGLLPARGVSDRVLEALATVVGSSAKNLREAGQAVAGAAAGEAKASQAFTRTVEGQEVASGPVRGEPAAEPPWDEVDALFRGGD